MLRNEVTNISRVIVNCECLHDLMVVTIDPRNIVVGCDYIIRFVGLEDFNTIIISIRLIYNPLICIHAVIDT